MTSLFAPERCLFSQKTFHEHLTMTPRAITDRHSRVSISWILSRIRIGPYLSATLLISSSALAQAVTGRLEGSLVTSTGQPATGIEVSVQGPSLQGVRRYSSDDRGRFSFPALASGIYTVEFRSVGYAHVRIGDVSVHVGVTTTLEPVAIERREAVQLETLVISGARPLLDLTSAAATISLDSAFFRKLPTARDVRSLLALVPLATPSFSGDGVNVAGSTGFENAYYINGIHATNPLSADGGINVPFNFVKDVQVVSGGYEAEFGRGQGAIVNVLTNSGGNEFRAEAVGYFAGDQLRAAPRWGIAESPTDRFSQYDVGLSVSGPLRRDRLWFFAAWNPLVEQKEVQFRGIPSQRDRRLRQLFAGTLTWKPAERTDLSFSILGDPTTHEAVSPAEVWSAPLPEVDDARVVLGDFREGGVAGSLQLHHQFGANVFLASSLTRLNTTRQHARRTGSDDPVSLARVDDNLTGITSGNFGRSYLVHTRRNAVDAAVTVLAGTHTVKVGGSYERNAIHIPYFKSSRVERLGDALWRWSREGWAGRGQNTVPAVFAQDSWEVTPWFRLNVGLRWDAQSIRGDTGIRFAVHDALAPRIGIVMQPGGAGVDKLTGTFGRFYEQLPLWAVSFWTMPSIGRIDVYPKNPVVDSANGEGSSYTLAGYPVDARVKGQHYDEVSLAYERRVGTMHRLGIRGVIRDLRWVIEDAVSEGAPPDVYDPHLGNPGRGLLSHVPRATRRYRGVTVELERGAGSLRYLASYTLSRTRGNYSGEFETDTRVPASHFQQSMDWPIQWAHHDGDLPNDRRHVAKVAGTWQSRSGFALGLTAWFATGTPLSEMSAEPLSWARTHVRTRGSVGRTPAIWNTDIRLARELAPGRRPNPQLVLDVFNIGNQRRAVDFEQLHFLSAERIAVNPNYLMVNQYQAPLRARVGLNVGF